MLRKINWPFVVAIFISGALWGAVIWRVWSANRG
jgi:hypothetical protein